MVAIAGSNWMKKPPGFINFERLGISDTSLEMSLEVRRIEL